jgi:hypothetical protein
MKRTILLVIISSFILVLIASCSSGITKEQYQKATNDLTTAQSQIQTLQTQLSTAQSQIQTLQMQLSTAQQQSTDKMTKVKALWDIFYTLFQPYFNGQTLTASQEVNLFLQLSNKVNAIGDTQLSTKFNDIVSNVGTNADTATMNFFVYLFDLLSRELQ